MHLAQTVVLMCIFLILAIYYCWTKYKELSTAGDNATDTFLTVSFGLDSYVNSERTWYWLSKY